MTEGLTRYKTPPPSDVIIVYDRPSLNDLTKVYPETCLYDENGGYYMKTMDGQVIAITADDLCEELDKTIAEADAFRAAHEAECEGCEYCNGSMCIEKA
ncbi:uncharacterized protein N7506_001035 [Penicillium brevicompactum]|uniref:uncharacterized protein n=1 Tax=Penicillium brevicompactum TaxID=5074 RepID=UPI00254259B6|nr:uncharacterized protein N7506_001035 [Penicillium brevicompactum]KAJ5347782.1 hypothetical protein N7506_001035 [Penicillium brevicompactum]